MLVFDHFRALPQRKRLGILCVLAIVALLIATLWPFDFSPSNKVSWLPDGNGLRFRGTSIVLSNALLKPAAAGSGESTSLEVLVRPASSKSVAMILSFYTADTRSEFVFGQQRDGLTVSRHFVNARDDARYPEIVADRVFEPGKLLFLTITSGSNGTVIYRNGGQPQVFAGFKIMQSDLAGQIVLGTSALLSEPYWGEIRGLAIYSKALTPAEVLRDYYDWNAAPGRAPDSAALQSSAAQGPIAQRTNAQGTIEQASIEQEPVARYDFAEKAGHEVHSAVSSAPDLEIPQRYVVPHKPFLESPGDEFVVKWEYVRTVLENIVGFVPLGFIVCAYLACTRSPRQAILYATLAGGSLSLVIEVLQFYVPPRGSGITDIITNTLGAAFGAMLARPRMRGTADS